MVGLARPPDAELSPPSDRAALDTVDQVYGTLRDLDGPVGREEILRDLAALGHVLTGAALDSALQFLIATGCVREDARGRFWSVKNARK